VPRPASPLPFRQPSEGRGGRGLAKRKGAKP
jgi:hypothetical protein